MPAENQPTQENIIPLEQGVYQDIRFSDKEIQDLMVPGSAFYQEISQAMQEEQTEAREEFVSNIEHDESDINTERISGFLSGYGLAMKPFIVIDKSEIPKLNELIGSEYEVENLGGVYISAWDIAVAVRNQENEMLNPGLTETILVHELAHANHKDVTYVDMDDDDSDIDGQVRIGFRVGKSNSFFEEGFAETMAVKYIEEELGQREGFINSDHPVHKPLPDNSVFAIPGKYWHYDPKIDYDQYDPAMAAYGMELLIARDPKIFDAMIKARSSIDGLREFAKRVNALSPGLYSRLQKLRYEGNFPREAHDFLQGVAMILDELYGGSQTQANDTIEKLQNAA